MKRIMIMGARAAGKISLIEAITGKKIVAKNIMAVEFFDNCIYTPSEFLENRFFYTSLITAAVDSDIVAMVQSAIQPTSVFPPNFSTVFNRRIIGIITHIEKPNARPDLAERFLNNAGAKEHLQVNLSSGEGIDDIRAILH